MAVIGSTGLPIGPRNKEWNGSDARRRVVDFYTKGDSTNWSQVERAFFWVDDGKADQLTGYSLGFADIVDGQLKALPRALFAVAGGHGVQRIRIPSSAKTAIKRKVNTYYRKMKRAFPSDDFDFDVPFPEVKGEDEETDMEDFSEEPEEVKAVMLEIAEKFFPLPMSATSFTDLAAMEAVREAVQKVFKTVYSFQELASNVARQSESIPELLTGLKSLTSEMADIFDNMTFKEPDPDDEDKETTENNKGLTCFMNSHDLGKSLNWEVKQNGQTALLKNEKGDQFFYGRFTNNLWDKDDEILLTRAHQEFVDYLDENPGEAPQLWDWHEEETAKTSRAIWWDWADGFLHAIWPVTEDEAKGIEAFTEEFEPGMSHGFKVLERSEEDPDQIAQYRTFEASILPLEFAANEWTTFKLIMEQKQHDLVTKRREERQKMFSPEKQRALELLSLGKYRIPLGKASEEDAAKIDETGVQRKEDHKDKKGTEPMSDQVEETPTTEEAPETPTQVPETPSVPPATLEALQASIVDGFQLITDRLGAIEEQVKTHGEALEGIKKKKGQSPSVAAWVASQRAETSVDSSPTENGTTPTTKGDDDDDDPLFGDGPEESAFEIDGHLLGGL